MNKNEDEKEKEKERRTNKTNRIPVRKQSKKSTEKTRPEKQIFQMIPKTSQGYTRMFRPI